MQYISYRVICGEGVKVQRVYVPEADGMVASTWLFWDLELSLPSQSVRWPSDIPGEGSESCKQKTPCCTSCWPCGRAERRLPSNKEQDCGAPSLFLGCRGCFAWTTANCGGQIYPVHLLISYKFSNWWWLHAVIESEVRCSNLIIVVHGKGEVKVYRWPWLSEDWLCRWSPVFCREQLVAGLCLRPKQPSRENIKHQYSISNNFSYWKKWLKLLFWAFLSRACPESWNFLCRCSIFSPLRDESAWKSASAPAEINITDSVWPWG